MAHSQPFTPKKTKFLPTRFRQNVIWTPLSRTRTTIPSHSWPSSYIHWYNNKFSPAANDEVTSLITSLKNKKRPGADKIGNKVVKILSKEFNLIPLQCHYLRYETAIIPAIVKTCDAYLHPERAKGHWENHSQELEFTGTNHCPPDFQHGFRRWHRCGQTLVVLSRTSPPTWIEAVTRWCLPWHLAGVRPSLARQIE